MEDSLAECVRLGYTLLGLVAVWIGYDIGYRF